MKKKIINGLLIAVVLVAATSSFVSCKDYDADNYNELQAKYLSLQDALNKQLSAMNDYVLKTTFNTKVGEIEGEIGDINAQTGYSATELANKGTIKKRLDDIEKELDPTNPNSLAEQVHKNNEAILSLGDTLEHFVFMWGDNLADAYKNAGKAKQIALSYETDTAKINQAIKDAQAVADKAWNYVNQGLAKDKDGNTKADFQAWVKYFEDADAALAEDIAALQKDVATLMEVAKTEVTSMAIVGVSNPIFGSFAYPYGIESNILATYFNEITVPVKFPAGDDVEALDSWVGSTPAVLTSELKDIDAKTETIGPGFVMNDNVGNAGTVCLLVNPQHVDMEGKSVFLRPTDNKSYSKVTLTSLKPCTDQYYYGYKRAAGDNAAFYTAQATITKDVVKDVAFSFDMVKVAQSVQGIMQDWSSVSASDLGKIILAVRDGLAAKIPQLHVYAPWKGVDGWTGTYSNEALAAFSVKPVGFEFFQEIDEKGGFAPAIIKFKNKLTAKEKAIEAELINKVAQLVAFQLNLTPIDPSVSGGNVEIDAAGNVYVVIPNGTFSSGSNVIVLAQGSVSTTPVDVPATNLYLPLLPNEAAGGYKINITPLINEIRDAINTKLAQVNSDASGAITNVMTKIINMENKVFDKVIGAAKTPGRFIQPALIARSSNDKLGYFYPSRFFNAPTQVQKGSKIFFYPTTLTAELLAPAFKKYVAVVGAWNVNDISEDRGAKQYNNPSYTEDKVVLNKVFYGSEYNAEKPFVFDTKDVPDGTVLEFIYEAVGYNGIVAGKKYYIEVYK